MNNQRLWNMSRLHTSYTNELQPTLRAIVLAPDDKWEIMDHNLMGLCDRSKKDPLGNDLLTTKEDT